MISNFNNDISIDEIINKNLIAVSIIKANKYEVVKNKIREQILIGINKKNIMNNSNKEFETDLAIKQPNNKKPNKINSSNNYFYYNEVENINSSQLDAYEGSEFSFI
jgi:hypothetical protein